MAAVVAATFHGVMRSYLNHLNLRRTVDEGTAATVRNEVKRGILLCVEDFPTAQLNSPAGSFKLVRDRATEDDKAAADIARATAEAAKIEPDRVAIPELGALWRAAGEADSRLMQMLFGAVLILGMGQVELSRLRRGVILFGDGGTALLRRRRGKAGVYGRHLLPAHVRHARRRAEHERCPRGDAPPAIAEDSRHGPVRRPHGAAVGAARQGAARGMDEGYAGIFTVSKRCRCRTATFETGAVGSRAAATRGRTRIGNIGSAACLADFPACVAEAKDKTGKKILPCPHTAALDRHTNALAADAGADRRRRRPVRRRRAWGFDRSARPYVGGKNHPI